MIYDQKPLLRLTQAELDAVIKKHIMFAKGRMGGARANFTYHDLSHLHFRSSPLVGADFTGAVLYGANLQGCNLDGCVFFVADLRKVDFSDASLARSDLRGCNLMGANLNGANLTMADLREGAIASMDRRGNINLLGIHVGADGKGHSDRVNASEASFARAKMQRSILRGANFTSAIFEKADLSQAQMQGVILQEAIMLGAVLEGVDLTEVDFRNALRDAPQGMTLGEDETPLEERMEQHKLWVESAGKQGERLDFTRYDLRGVDSAATDFSKAALSMMKARAAVFYRQRFSGAEMQAVELRDCDLRGCFFDGANLAGADFSGSNLSRAVFMEARLAPLQLGGGRVLRSSFSRCNLRFADFSAADLREVNFSGADLSHAHFRGANLVGADLTETLSEGAVFD